MFVAEYTGQGRIQVVEGTARPPGPGEVQLDVAYVGICGTDLHILHGVMDARVAAPQSIGHEMSGTVAAVGPDVAGWQVGDRVTVIPLDWDGICPACRAGHQHICQHLNFIGIDSPGALQQTWTVKAATLVPLPAAMPLDQAALAEPVAVAVHDVRRSGLVSGDRAVVLGAGPIGVLIASVASDLEAQVLVAEIDPGRRASAQALGFEVVHPDDLPARVDAWTEDAGADVVFEVSGAAAAVVAATAVAKVRGTVVVVAIHGVPRPVDLKQVFWRELTIVGARVYTRADFDTAVELLHTGRIPVDGVVTDVVPLAEVAQAFARLERGAALKILIDMSGSPR